MRYVMQLIRWLFKFTDKSASDSVSAYSRL